MVNQHMDLVSITRTWTQEVGGVAWLSTQSSGDIVNKLYGYGSFAHVQFEISIQAAHGLGVQERSRIGCQHYPAPGEDQLFASGKPRFGMHHMFEQTSSTINTAGIVSGGKSFTDIQ